MMTMMVTNYEKEIKQAA